MRNNKLKVAFLDRDGVINKEVNYLHDIEHFEYTEGCIGGLLKLQQLGYKLIVITNQSGIARGYYTSVDYQKLTDWYVDDLRLRGVYILDVFHCPHHPTDSLANKNIQCTCRKPGTGLIEKATAKYNIALADSILVGDKTSDILTGIYSGIGHNFLVRTGYAVEQGFNLCDVLSDLTAVAEHVCRLQR
ncbi:D-glycero-alpha-D-manno-heptose-1,7-bisphosphate 7-phosphatase [Paraferrimonas haliotis]|uniref:D-glycero-alpha-D-manno-heptose-1,7-bisphosphate 7-phosphatase n=1 Tax=Paraferrimonas haliotis TaxID=2013866 RepID=UPI000BA9A3AE|nr:HAD family hydrolase [Paraferrimonas haliotis]